MENLDSGSSFSSTVKYARKTGPQEFEDNYDSYGNSEEPLGSYTQPAAKKKNKAKIISNVRLASPTRERPPPTTVRIGSSEVASVNEEWSTVRRSKKRVESRGYSASSVEEQSGLSGPNRQHKVLVAGTPQNERTIKRKVPKGSVVSITGHREDFSYADALKLARNKLSLRELGIDGSKIRRAANGGVLIEIPGIGSEGRADLLAEKLSALIGEEVKVSRPSMRGDVKLYNFDDSILPAEVVSLFVEIGKCSSNVIKISTIRRQRNGLNVVWVNCPIQLAIKVAKLGKVAVGWSMAGVELMKKRPTKCFKCWHFGHLKNTCPNTTDRQGCCFRCGDKGHSINDCFGDFRCFPCLDLGLDSDHRSGNNLCQAYNRLMQGRGPPTRA